MYIYSVAGPSLVPAASVVPVARYGACEVAWHGWERPVVTGGGVVPASALVLVFPAGAIEGLLLIVNCILIGTEAVEARLATDVT